MKLPEDADAALRKFLNDCIGMMTAHNQGRRPGWKYATMESFVLTEGVSFNRIEQTPIEMQGEPRQCFLNALMLCVARPEWTYVEGFAYGVIPTLHAWVLRDDGTIIDPTWRDKLEGKAYIGVPMKTQFVTRYRRKHRTLSIIDAWEAEWPILKGNEKGWRRPIPQLV